MSITFSQYTMKPLQKQQMEQHTIGIPSISDTIIITDSRTIKDFKDQVFGGYKLNQASAALEKALVEDKLEPALHWSAQLLLSGLITPLWTKLMSFAIKNINIYNPRLPEFIYNKHQEWQRITDNPKFARDSVLELRNHPTIRLLIAEMITILVLSKKRKINQPPRIKQNEFLIDTFRGKLEAKDNRLIDGITQDGDPSEIKIAINEMAHHIYNSNVPKSLYWLNWITEWEKINSKKYGKYECAARTPPGIDAKFHRDVVWLIWAVINKIRQLKFSISNGEINRQITALYNLYLNKFTPASRARKQGLIIWTILYIADSGIIDLAIPLVDRPPLLFQSLLGFDKIIMALKSQEVHRASAAAGNMLNVVVENNYMMPENHSQLEAARVAQLQEQARMKEEQAAKKQGRNGNNLNPVSMKKLNDVYKLDRMMFS